MIKPVNTSNSVQSVNSLYVNGTIAATGAVSNSIMANNINIASNLNVVGNIAATGSIACYGGVSASTLSTNTIYLNFTNPQPSLTRQELYTFPNIEADYQIYLSEYFSTQIYVSAYVRTYNSSMFIAPYYSYNNFTLTSTGLTLKTAYFTGGIVDVKLRILRIG